MKEKTISERERKCLDALYEFYFNDEADCIYFRTIVEKTGMELKDVRRSVRALARKGFAEFTRGLFDDDGMVAGSGYCCTREGAEFLKRIRESEEKKAEEQTAQKKIHFSEALKTGDVIESIGYFWGKPISEMSLEESLECIKFCSEEIVRLRERRYL